MRFRGAILALPLVLLAGPAAAVKDWYDFYEEGKQQVARGRCAEALASLAQARRLKPSSELEVRPYGLVFLDYVPYYYEGLCHAKLGDLSGAIRAFDAEEKQGAIKKNKQLYADLIERRGRVKKAQEDAATARGALIAAMYEK